MYCVITMRKFLKVLSLTRHSPIYFASVAAILYLIKIEQMADFDNKNLLKITLNLKKRFAFIMTCCCRIFYLTKIDRVIMKVT